MSFINQTKLDHYRQKMQTCSGEEAREIAALALYHLGDTLLTCSPQDRVGYHGEANKFHTTHAPPNLHS